MEFNQLAAVVAVADEGSFTAAAHVLGHSQPAVSQAVRGVERELGVPLFDRHSTGVTVTSAGEAFLAPARQALHDREVARDAVRSVVGLESGHLDIACIPSLAADIAAPVVGAFRRRHPAITVRLPRARRGRHRRGPGAAGPQRDRVLRPAAIRGRSGGSMPSSARSFWRSCRPAMPRPSPAGGPYPWSASPNCPSSPPRPGHRPMSSSPSPSRPSARNWRRSSSPTTGTQSSPSCTPAPGPLCCPGGRRGHGVALGPGPPAAPARLAHGRSRPP